MLYPTLWRARTPRIRNDVFGLRNDFDRFFRGALDDVAVAWAPEVDIRETESELTLVAELPGLSAKDVTLNVEDGVLTMSGEKKHEVENTDGTSYHLIERRHGRFERKFRLPRTVNAGKVGAEFRDGELTVTLPKVEEAKPRKIEIKVK